MRAVTLPSVLALTGLVLPGALKDDPPALRGFSAESARREIEWEARFRAQPEPDSLRSYMRRLSARPHHLGSAYDSANAEWIRERLASWGWEAQIEVFEVLFPTPLERVVELIEPRRRKARLREPAVPGDPSSTQQAEQLPTYNAYSIDGDVTAPLVYVNYGTPADYDSLARRGVSVAGAIVLARYGRSWRGIKPKVAAEHGAVGCIIYSDPDDDGYHGGEVYPAGPWRPLDGVQRGSVMDMPLHPGDPQTPGVGATPGTPRLPLAEVKTLTEIPVLPVSYGDALPLLSALSGPVAPRAWQGGLGVTYHLGPGAARVHLRLRFDWKTVRLYDVIARIPGTSNAEEWIVRGNHHDAWVNGAEDPISGQVALLEEARALGGLLRAGWKPRRTIVYAAWDGEEQGLLGSTEWSEAHADELRRHAAVYLNTDGNGRGYLGMAGSHSLERFINEVARDITDPETGLSAWKRLQLRSILQSDSAGSREEARTRGDLRIGALGSGSDYTPFLQHLGIASLDLGFGGEDGGGIYHSIYDDFRWYTSFSDTSFAYGRALAQTVGTAVMRLAGAELIPFEFTRQADTYDRYLKELKDLLAGKQKETAELNQQLDEGVFAATADPREQSVAPSRLDQPPHLNFAPLENALDSLRNAAARYRRAVDGVDADRGSALQTRPLDRLNANLRQTERALTDPEGLPRRPWFQHLIYAPGFYTGYGVKTVPGVREAFEQRQWAEAEREILRAADRLTAEAGLIADAASEIEGWRK